MWEGREGGIFTGTPNEKRGKSVRDRKEEPREPLTASAEAEANKLLPTSI